MSSADRVEHRNGCLTAWFGKREPIVPPPPNGGNDNGKGGEEPAMDSPPSIEVFAMPGHGRTSFLWSMLFMLRQLSRVWPGYLCWPLDQATGRSLLEIHEKLRAGELPERSTSDQGKFTKFALHLRNMNPWGERFFVVRDSPDGVFTAEKLNGASALPAVDWNRPALWLLSLSDLDEVRGRFLDLALDDLIRARHSSCEAARQYPSRLMVVLTKGDALGDLPSGLRSFLKDDPLARELAESSGGLFRAHDGIDLAAAKRGLGTHDMPDPVGAYFESRRAIDALARDWLSSNSAGRALLGRAEELKVDLKLSVVSATGSGIISGGRLATAWSPRRVLDPYFWALELGA